MAHFVVVERAIILEVGLFPIDTNLCWPAFSNPHPARDKLNMANEFDPYREALVMEEVTNWGDVADDLDRMEQERLARELHGSAEDASNLSYERTHTGFCRVITVTEKDLQRLKAAKS